MPKIEFETYWVGGHQAPGRAIDLANAAAEAVHTLNYATMNGAGGLVYPSNAGSIVSGLQSAVGNMHQLLEQLADFVDQLGHDGRLYHDQPGQDARAAAATGRAQLQAAASMSDVLRSSLDRVYSTINHLGLRDDAEQANEGPVAVDDRPTPLPRRLRPTGGALPFSVAGVVQ
jgi:hypothetical protein